MGAPEEEVNARARSRLGTVLRGKYRLDRVLGVGGMAAVFAATHLRNTNRVAVKVLHRELAIDEGLRARFLREGYAANSVEHPGTVRILDDDIAEDGAVYLVMELFEGETLEARWERKAHRLDAREVMQLMHQLLDVLAFAHGKGIVHRDIKPENLFFTRQRTLKVLDFGVARLLEGSARVTRVGGVLGTPAFMAPEQVLAKTREIDARSDLWSVGATAFTLLSGRDVHDGETPEEMMVFAASRPARSLAAVAPDLPAPLVGVVDRALMLDRSERWPDARAMQQAIASAYEEAFGTPLADAELVDEEPVDEEEEEDDKTAVICAADLPNFTREALCGSPTDASSPAPAAAPAAATGPSPVTMHRIEFLHSDATPVTGSSALPAETAVPARPSTIDGVAATQRDSGADSATFEVRAGARRPAFGRAALGALAMVLAAGFIAVVAARNRLWHPPSSGSPTQVSLEVGPVPADPAPPAPAASAATKVQVTETPSFAVEELPAKPPTTNATTRQKTATKPSGNAPSHPSTSGRSPPASAQQAQTNPNCTPPFTVDELTGWKKWKVECL